MSEISRAALFGKLNKVAYKAIESATTFCKMRGNAEIEFAHWIYQVLQLQDSDLHRLIKSFELSEAHLAADLTDYLESLPQKPNAVLDFSWVIEEALERAWVLATLLFNDDKVRTGYLLAAMVKEKQLRNQLTAISAEFKKINWQTLADSLDKILKGSPESGSSAQDGSSLAGGGPAASGDAAPAAMGKQEALAKYTTDLTEQARNGEIDPIVGRDEEIRQIVDILMRRRQNNPILTGEAGVGKTAVVEGLAHRIASGDIPPSLKDVSLKLLDIGLLQAGASMKGEFEERLRQVIEEVQSSETPIIMFIDEAHTLIGAGGSAGTGDAANLLKPALARGQLRTIAATTWAEYKKHIEKDPALTRRFQVVQVPEPEDEKAIRMLRSMNGIVEKHHGVLVLDEAVEAAVKLSSRYIPSRQLPDKAVSLIDTACARVALTQHATPARIEDTTRQIEALQVELTILDREQALGLEQQERRDKIAAELATAQTALESLQADWDKEKELAHEVIQLRAALDKAQAGEAEEGFDVEASKARLIEQQNALGEIQKQEPLVLPEVNAAAVASVVQDWTGIPVGRMVGDEIQSVLNLSEDLKSRIVGQEHALEMISKRVQTSRAGLENPNKPIGVFLLAGPSGVGKTETALALAERLYGGEQNLITINMSEFQEAHTVSTLKGAPPGYVGYGEGGVLTEAVRRRPYSVILLDEVEKAHTDVHEIFFQVFDKGHMEDGEGRQINFRNNLILLTTNAGSELIMNMCKDPELAPEADDLAQAIREPLLKVFPPALLGRMVTIPYYPLSDDMLGSIIRMQLDKIVQRVKLRHDVEFTYDDEVVALVGSRCQELESGGRMVDAILTNTVLPELSRELLNRQLAEEPLKKIELFVKNQAFSYTFSGV